jgi:phospho-N-acetylmuramoyl-pentapeptide-transferase
MVQVVVFRRYRRRVFLMAPLHHHFEMAGWSETKIIVRLWLIALIVGSIGFTLYFRSVHR